MPKLPQLKWKPAPPGRVDRLARWFEEWRSEQELRQSDPDYARPVELPARERVRDLRFHGLIAPFDSDPKPRDIRLLSSLLFPTFRRHIYVAILARKEDWFIVVPFGPFFEPATTTEWATGRSDLALRVLCLWNARTLPASILAQSWIVDELSKTEQQTAWSVFQHALKGTKLSEELLSTVGAPIAHQRDPRLQYQADEMEIFAPLSRRAMLEATDYSGQSGFSHQNHEETALAAGSRDTAYELIGQWERRIEGSPCRLRFSESPLEITVLVIDANGNPSRTCDQAQLIDRDNRLIEVFDGPLTTIRRDSQSLPFAIRTTSGAILNLI